MSLRPALLALLALLALAPMTTGCLANAAGPGMANDDDGTGPGDDDDDGVGPDRDDPRPDPQLCVGDGGNGGVCEVTGDCDDPLICLGGRCVGPNDPSHTCDLVDNHPCTGAGEECVAGLCVVPPGACLTTDQCPVGWTCQDAQCVPEVDGEACLDPGPGPSLTGTWQVRSTLHLRDGMPGLASGALTATEILGDFIEGTVDLGLPAFIEAAINFLIPGIIDQFVPDWAQDLVLALSNLSDVLDDMQVDATMELVGDTCQASYRGYERWDRLTFEYRGAVVSRAPSEIPEIGEVEPEEFGARYECGYLYVDRHRIHNTLSGLVRWVVDTTVEIATGYPTLEAALDAVIDCRGIADGINDAWGSVSGGGIDIADEVFGVCDGIKQGLVDQLNAMIDDVTLTLSVVSLQGRARVDGERGLSDGTWNGSVLGWDFPGEFAGER